MRDLDVLVVGAGPVGMFAALSLRRAGLAVEVIDEAPRRAGHSYAVGLHPRSVLLLDQLGLLDALLPHGQRIDGVVLISGHGERQASLAELPGGRGWGLALPQNRLEEALESALLGAGSAVRWNERLALLDAGSDPPAATVDTLARDGSGYAFAETVTVVGRRRVLRPRFVLGADGHRSTVARQLGAASRELGRAQAFVAFEVRLREAGVSHELRLVLGDDTVDSIWPLPGGRYRCTFEVGGDDLETPMPREKDRSSWWISTAESRVRISRLLAERAPWLGSPTELGWSASARFERRLATSWGRGGVWLLGDAAHTASPLASHSLNRGFHEASELAASCQAIATGATGPEALTAWAQRSLEAWDWETEAPFAVRDPWLLAHAPRLREALPATGAALRELLQRLRIECRTTRAQPMAAT